MNFRSAVKSVPGDLIFTGYTWETTREHYFMRHANWSKASEVRELRKLYAARLWDECGVSVDLEKGFQ